MVHFQPDSLGTVTPRIVVSNPEALVAFIKHVFAAQGEYRTGQPTQIRIGDSVIMVSGTEAGRDVFPAFLYVYVEDADAIYQRAVAMKARSIEAPSDMPYGDRRAMVRDVWGNVWQIATHRHSVLDIR
jgi:PhnB protein